MFVEKSKIKFWVTFGRVERFYLYVHLKGRAKMKRKCIVCVITAAATALVFSGCSKDVDVSAGKAATAFVYEQSKEPKCIAAEGEVLYALESDEGKAVLSVYGSDGGLKSRASLEDLGNYGAFEVKHICVYENKVYGAVLKSGKVTIHSFDAATGEVKKICELEGLDGIDKIGGCEGRLYWIGNCLKEAEEVEPVYDEDSGREIYYSDTGKKMGCIDPESGENFVSEIDFPISFAVSGDKVTVYAFEPGKGFYFADYAQPEEKSFNNKLEGITNLEYYGGGGEFVFLGSNAVEPHVLPVGKAEGEGGIVRVINNAFPYFPSELCASENGSVWIINSDTVISTEKRVERYDLGDIKITGKPIRAITNGYFPDRPFIAGSEVSWEELSGEGFALKVLSLDSDYDAAMICSDESAAHDIKENGSFYPLNDVPGVEEYLDSCFPYIKEAVTDEDGSIRMLPVNVEIPIVIYNEKNCSEAGIKFSPELELFIEAVEKASEVSEYYDITRYRMIEGQLNSYLSDHVSFDTEIFRDMAELLKERCTEEVFRFHPTLSSALMSAQFKQLYVDPTYVEALFIQHIYRSQQIQLIKDPNLRAVSAPVSESGKAVARCTFICVNPYSDRLSETLKFIEMAAAGMCSERNSGMLKDKGTYDDTPMGRDFYSVYENGEICFQVPSEIYWDDFGRYCGGEIGLDEFIKEADRKMETYFNE